jgi:hypothetical protein
MVDHPRRRHYGHLAGPKNRNHSDVLPSAEQEEEEVVVEVLAHFA